MLGEVDTRNRRLKVTWFNIFMIYLSFLVSNSFLLYFSTMNIEDFLNPAIYEDFENNTILNFFILTLISFLAPTVTIFIKFLFLIVLVYIFNLSKVFDKKSIIWIATLSYIPSLIGSIINYFANWALGNRAFGYTSLYSYIQPSNSILSYLFIRINPFEIAGILLMGVLFTRFSGGNAQDTVIIISIWYIADFLLTILL